MANGVAEKVRYYRQLRGLSQEGLARKLGMSRGTVLNVEGGKKFPEWETLEEIAQALGVDWTELLPEEPFLSTSRQAAGGVAPFRSAPRRTGAKHLRLVVGGQDSSFGLVGQRSA